MLDLPFARAASEQPAEIMQKDPLWLHGLTEREQRWLSGPLRRSGLETTQPKLRLETACPLPGSYQLTARVTAHKPGQPPREFSVYRYRRYDADKLTACLAELGWEKIFQFVYGVGRTPTMALLLYRLRADL